MDVMSGDLSFDTREKQHIAHSLKGEVNSSISLLSFPLMKEQSLQDSALKVVSNASEFGFPHHLDNPSL